MNVLIIEDEPKAAAELGRIIKTIRPAWCIVQNLATVAETVRWFRTHAMPDLVFSDIQLADGTSFEAFRAVEVRCPIIFCTAYDEYAIRAFETNSVDYILKPVNTERLEQALGRLHTMGTIFAHTLPTPSFAPPRQTAHVPATTILVHHREKIIPVRYDDIAFFYYNGALVSLTLTNGSTYCLVKTLDEIEAETDPGQFFRANRQFVVNAASIAEIQHGAARKLIVKTTPEAPRAIVVSKAKAPAFLRWMEQ